MDDLLLLEEEYSVEELLIRDTVREFVNAKVVPIASEAFENAEFPKTWIENSASLGLLGLTLPTEYNCAGASYVAYGLACQELEAGDSGLRSFVSVQSSLCMYPIYSFGTEEQKTKFLPKMAVAELIACFGLTEADAGSDPASMRTTAKKVEGGWVLNGSKFWITNAPIADLAIVWAKTQDGIRGFIVEKEFKGFSAKEIPHKMSLRASTTGELVFDNVFVPDENYLPGSEKGLGAALSCLNQARYGIAWGVMGAARAVFDITVQYLLNRKQFSRPLASFQLVQKDLADIYTEILKAQCLNLRVGRLKDLKKDNPNMTSLIKGNSCRQALKIARSCRNL